jgi:hypothetical protein
MADRLGLPLETPGRWKLWAQSPPPGAARILDLTDTPGVRAKLSRLRWALIPPPAYIRGLYPGARRSRVALAGAYARRVLGGLRQAPAAGRAVRRARAGHDTPR